jgi:hypothetical protein
MDFIQLCGKTCRVKWAREELAMNEKKKKVSDGHFFFFGQQCNKYHNPENKTNVNTPKSNIRSASSNTKYSTLAKDMAGPPFPLALLLVCGLHKSNKRPGVATIK